MNSSLNNLIGVLTSHVQKDTENLEVYSLLGSLLREAGSWTKAVKIHRNILAKPLLKKSLKIEILTELAKDHHAGGNLDEAKKCLDEALKLDHKNSDALSLLLDIQRKASNFEDAVETAEKTEKLDPKIFSSIYTEYAEKLLEEGQVGKAKKILKKAISIHADNIGALTLMGDACMKEEDYQNAISNYFTAISRNPAYTSMILKRVENAFFQSNSFDELSSKLREELYSKGDNSDMHHFLGQFLKKRRLSKEAKQEFKKAIEFNPTHLDAREELIKAYLEEKDIEGLMGEFKNLFQEIKKNLSYICTKCSNREKFPRWKCPSCGAFDSYEKTIFLF